MTERKEYQVTIEPSLNGRGYVVTVHRGCIRYEGYKFAWTLRGATRKGERALARLRRNDARVARTAGKIRKAGLR